MEYGICRRRLIGRFTVLPGDDGVIVGHAAVRLASKMKHALIYPFVWPCPVLNA